MSHYCRYSEMIMPLNKLPSPEPMPRGIAEDLAPDDSGNTQEAVADGVLAPCGAALIQEQFALPALCHEAGNDSQRLALKVNDALGTLALGLFSGKHDALPVKLDMPALDMANLLRPASGLPDKYEQITERIGGFQQGKDFLVIPRLHVSLAALCGRLLHACKRAAFKMALLYRPVVNPLDGHDSTPAVGAAPGGMRIHPLCDIEGLDAGSRKVGYARICQKALKMTLIPFKAAGSAVLGAPEKIFGCKVANRDAVHHNYMSEKTHLWGFYLQRNNYLEDL